MPPAPPARPTDSEPPGAAAPDRWRLGLLGGLHLQGGTQVITRLPSRAVAALLARLAMAPGRVHGREELVELLWPGVGRAVGRNRLRQALSTLRALLEPPGHPPLIEADRLGVKLLEDRIDCDARRFEALLRHGHRAQAAALYRGELMPGFYDDWIVEERHRLSALADALADAPAPAASPAAAPATGRAAGPAAAGPAPPAGPAPVAPAWPLPAYLTRYFGGSSALEALLAAVARHRLVTLLGPGGSGKTRLAAELAHTLRNAGPAAPAFDLVAFVPLAACSELAAMHDALRGAFALPAGGDGIAADLAPTLAGRHALLVLDNLEPLLPAAADTVRLLLEAWPALRVVATSRLVLGVDGEQEFEVPRLALPGAGADAARIGESPAVALFVDRARAVRADFHLGERNAATLAAIVATLGGLPLAIELAASRVRTVAPSEMLRRLRAVADGEPPSARPGLALLARAAPRDPLRARHASMEAVVAWSWHQLDDRQQALLVALAVFPAGCDAEAAAAVSGGEAVDDTVDALLRHSMLAARPARDGTLRFTMEEPIREFVLARAGAGAWLAARAAQRRWSRAWVQALPRTPPLGRLQLEMPNLLAALATALADGVPAEALELALALRPALADVPLPAGGVQRVREALAREPAHPARAELLAVLAFAGYRQGEREQALHDAGQALADAAPASMARARALHTLASLRWRVTRKAEGLEPLLAESLAIAIGHDDPGVQASVHALRGMVAGARRGGGAEAEALQRQALVQWERQGNRHAVNGGHYNLAYRAAARRDWQGCLQRLHAVCRTARDDEDWRQLSQALNLAANAHAGLRDWPASLAALQESAEIAWAGACAPEWAIAMWNAPHTLAWLRLPDPAARLMAFAERHWQRHFGAHSESDRRELRRLRRLVQVQLGSARWLLLHDEGGRLEPAEAMSLLRSTARPAGRRAAAAGGR